MREIDCIRQRIDLGSDTYANGKISNEKWMICVIP